LGLVIDGKPQDKMKKWFSLLFFFFLITPLYSADSDSPLFNFTSFSGGVNTNDLPDKILDTQVQEVSNFWFQKNNGLSRREGFGLKVTSGSLGCLGLWNFRDVSGNEWLIRLNSDGTLVAGKTLGSENFSVTITTLSVTERTNGATGLLKFWFTNKTDGLQFWDGTTYGSYHYAPIASQLKVWRNRVILADISNEQSSLRFSGELAGEDWTNNSRFSTSPISIRIGGVNDGDKVFGINVGFDELVVFKSRAMYGIGGNDQRDFYVRQISDSIGSVYPNTIRQYFNVTIFLSNRGLDSYTPSYTFNFIGNPIKNYLDPLAILGSQARYFTQSSQVQWGLGISVPTNNISSNVVTGDIFTAYLSTGDTTGDDFAKDSWESDYWFMTRTTTTENVVFTSTHPVIKSILNGGFEEAGTVDATESKYWRSDASGIFNRDGAGTRTGSWGMRIQDGGQGFLFNLRNREGKLLLSGGYNSPLGENWTEYILDTSVYVGTTATLFMYTQNSGISYSLSNLDYSIKLSTSINFWCKRNGSEAIMSVDDISIATSNISVEVLSLRSPTYTKNISTLTFSRLDSSVDASISGVTLHNSTGIFTNGKATFSLSQSLDPSTGWKNIQVVTGSYNIFGDFPYQSYTTSFTFLTTDSVTQTVRILLSSVTLVTNCTGYYQRSHNIGGQITSWGLFTSVYGDSITFQVQQSSDEIYEDGDWKMQLVNSSIAIPVNSYLGVRCIFYTTTSVNFPYVSEYTINWNEGESPPNPLSMTNQDNYFLFFSTKTGSGATNDKIVVYEQNKSITFLDGVKTGGASEYVNKLTLGDANNTGNIYTLEASSSGTDNNTPIESSVKFKRLGADNDSYKIWEKFYYTISRTDVSKSQIWKTEYYINGGTNVWYSSNIELSTGTPSGIIKSAVPISNQVKTLFVDIRVSEVTKGRPYSIHSVRGYGKIQRPD
jgi:hypothetical protein